MSWLEITGFVFGIAGIWLTLRENPWCFPTGLVNVTLSLFLFYDQHLYADALQQFVYIILLSYGWHNWLNGNKGSLLLISRSSRALLTRCLILWVCGTIFLGFLLSNFTDAATPWPDSAATVLSFIAQWMIAKKKIENWILWVFVNVTYITIYIYKDLYLYAILFALYLLLAIWGYIYWKKEMKGYEAN